MSISKCHKHYVSLDTKIGKEMLFLMPNGEKDQMFSFSSTLEKIGYEWDMDLKNRSSTIWWYHFRH